MSTWSDCRLQWFWTYSERYKPIGRSFTFDLGNGIHTALADYYRDGADPVGSFVQWIKAEKRQTIRFMDAGGPDIERALEADLEVLDEAMDLGIMMLEQYAKNYSAESMEVLAVEEWVTAPIPGTEWEFVCVIDAVVKDHARRGNPVFVLEHKTFTRFEEGYLDKDHQFVAEAWLARKLVDEPIEGVLYNGLRKAFPHRTKKALFERKEIPVNDHQIGMMLKRVRGMYRDLTRGKVSIYPEPGQFKCNMCKFKDVCTLYQRGEDYQELLDIMFTTPEQRDAYEEAES